MRILVSVLLVSLLAGCLAKSTSTYVRSADGAIKSVVTVMGTGDKVSEVAAEGLFADEDGAGVAKSNASQQSSGVAESLQAVVQALALGLNMSRGDSSMTLGSLSGTTGASSTFAGAATEGGLTSFSNEGFSGVPGLNGVGVYGKTSCGRCQTYLKTHPGIELIDLERGNNSADMWAALRVRGFTGSSVQLPVQITEDGYTEMAK